MGRDLTPREREILGMVSQGRTNPWIADALDISPHTVKTHIAFILWKLEATCRYHAVAVALRRGVIE